MRKLTLLLPAACMAWLAFAAPLRAQATLESVNQRLDQIDKVGLGHFEAGQYKEAVTAFTEGFELCRSSLKQFPDDPGLTESAYYYLVILGKSFEKLERYADALQMQTPGANGYYNLAKADPTPDRKARAATEMGNLAWIQLLNNDPAAAMQSSKEALSFDPNLVWLQTNLAHALAMSGRTEEAKAIYLKYKNEMMPSGKTFKEVSLEDAELLKKHAGATALSKTVYNLYYQDEQASGQGGMAVAPAPAPGGFTGTSRPAVQGAPAAGPSGSVNSSNSGLPVNKSGITAADVDRMMASSKNNWWVFLFVPLIFVAVGVVFFIIWQLDKKRALQLEAKAKELGLIYRRRPQAGDENFLTGTQLHRMYGGARSIGNIIEYMDGPDRVSFFDYAYSTGTGKQRRVHRMTIGLVISARLTLPAFVLRRETFQSKVTQWFGTQDINFAEHPAFSRQYLLQGADEAAVRRAFQPQVLDFCTRFNELYMEGQGSRVMFFTQRGQISAENLQEFMARAKSVLSAFTGSGTAPSLAPSPAAAPSGGPASTPPPLPGAPVPAPAPAPVASEASAPVPASKPAVPAAGPAAETGLAPLPKAPAPPPIPSSYGNTPPPIPE